MKGRNKKFLEEAATLFVMLCMGIVVGLVVIIMLPVIILDGISKEGRRQGK